MTMSPCLDCGEPCTGPRCPEHSTEAKGSADARGYDAAWKRLAKRAKRLSPFCEDCGATEDLQCDHLPSAWERKATGKPIRLADVAVTCGPCNRARGAARGHSATRGSAPGRPSQPPSPSLAPNYTPQGVSE